MKNKLWLVWHDSYKQQYQLEMLDSIDSPINKQNPIAIFISFDMAYQYLCVLNGNNMQNSYSRWTVCSKAR